jgi:esterase/lipase superfamily enzyme
LRFAALVCLMLVFAACAPRGALTLDPQAALVGEVRPIFVGTTRAAAPSGEYDGGRSDHVTYARYDVSVPPERAEGEINWPPKHAKADPHKNFLTTAITHYQTAPAFRQDLSQSLRHNGGEAVVFVHGFNNTFSEGMYRIAQMAHDLGLPGVVVHYSWPSAAQPLGYVYDRDSALFARDGLEALLNQVEKSGARKIVLVAHSMGSGLLMETLRQISIRDKTSVLRHVTGVVLIAPDIDVDVFHAQATAITPFPKPFVIFSSGRDSVLKLSARLTGQADRLGTLTDLSRVADLPVTFLDTAAFNSGSGHFDLGNSPTLLRLMDGIISVDASLDADRASRIGLLPGVVLTVQNATQIILRPVADLGTAR